MKKLAIAVATMFALVGCGELVEVPPAHIAKVMTKNGYKEQTIPTSKFRLEPCIMYCDKLVLLDASDQAVTEKMELFMPKDKLNMAFEIRLTLIVNPDKFNEIFTRIPPSGDAKEHIDRISVQRVYATYAQQIIRAEAREFLSNFSIAEIASSREAINNQLSERLTASISQRTPFQVRYVGLADLTYPQIIVEAQENAAQRRETIQKEEAELEISRVQLERQLQEQRLQRTIDIERAEAEAAVNRILANSVTPQYVKYRELSLLEAMTKSENKIFIPSSMLDSIAGQVQLGRQ